MPQGAAIQWRLPLCRIDPTVMRTDLSDLLAHLQPVLLPHAYVFCHVDSARRAACLALPPLATFREAEGLSVVLRRSHADALGLPYDSVHGCITLTVRSSLQAVGLTAAIATALAAEGLSANVIAAFHHDHVFVPDVDAQRALRILQGLAEAHATTGHPP